jgi:anti-sigma factor RsiW
MDHNEALQLQAAEKYVLGELSQPLRDEFEEHFFECQECALDVKAAAGFADNASRVLALRRLTISGTTGGSSPPPSFPL